MTKHTLIHAGLIVGVGLMLVGTAVAQRGQAPALATSVVQQQGTKPVLPSYTSVMTSWGEPDIFGMWPLNHLVTTILVRNPQLGDKLYLTEEEFKVKKASLEQSSKQKASGTLPFSES